MRLTCFGLPMMLTASLFLPATTAEAAPRTAAIQTVAFFPASHTQATLDPRCKRRGKVLCADKSGSTLLAVKNGKVIRRFDARFGRPGFRTTNGSHRIYWKSRHHVSSIYHSPMPWAMFFHGGEAIHFSPRFAANGFRGPGSHGCINIRSKKSAQWLWDWSPVGTRVVVTP